MHDPRTFEDRLQSALGRYADQVPTQVDAVAFVRATRRTPAHRGLTLRAAPSVRLALLLGLLVAAAIAIAAVVGAPPPPRIYSGVFTPTGSLAVPRSGHTATLLRDGRVLVVGGEHRQRKFIAAELYDPRADTFSETGRLTAAIDECCEQIDGGYAITALADGRALVVGGVRGANHPLASAELYDPRTGTFTPTGPLLEPRRRPTAALLADGRVMVAGGTAERFMSVTTAELYDPVTGTFTAAGPTGERIDTATLLVDGRVLVTGFNSSLGHATAELYDPKNGRFTLTGPMIAVDTPTAMLLRDGRVLFTGVDPVSENQTIAEIYDPVAGTFASTGPLIDLFRLFQEPATTVLQDGRVLILGGDHVVNSAGAHQTVASAELYDPQAGTLTPTGSLVGPRFQATATLLQDGRVLVAGGADGDEGLLDSAELYR